MEPPLDLEGSMCYYDPKDDPTNDCFRAGGDLWRVLTEGKKQILIENTSEDMAAVTENIKYRHAAHCYLADVDMASALQKLPGLISTKLKSFQSLITRT